MQLFSGLSATVAMRCKPFSRLLLLDVLAVAAIATASVRRFGRVYIYFVAADVVVGIHFCRRDRACAVIADGNPAALPARSRGYKKICLACIRGVRRFW